jgi:hypothetical protein
MKPTEYGLTMMKAGALAELALGLPVEEARGTLAGAIATASDRERAEALADGTIEDHQDLLDALAQLQRVARRIEARKAARPLTADGKQGNA